VTHEQRRNGPDLARRAANTRWTALQLCGATSPCCPPRLANGSPDAITVTEIDPKVLKLKQRTDLTALGHNYHSNIQSIPQITLFLTL
jgi:hypothetical protein